MRVLQVRAQMCLIFTRAWVQLSARLVTFTGFFVSLFHLVKCEDISYTCFKYD
jgi:hypothetical protein